MLPATLRGVASSVAAIHLLRSHPVLVMFLSIGVVIVSFSKKKNQHTQVIKASTCRRRFSFKNISHRSPTPAVYRSTPPSFQRIVQSHNKWPASLQDETTTPPPKHLSHTPLVVSWGQPKRIIRAACPSKQANPFSSVHTTCEQCTKTDPHVEKSSRKFCENWNRTKRLLSH